MAEITTAQTGNSSSTSSWVGGVVPGSGDTIVFGSASHVITVDQDITIGNAGANDIDIDGELIIADGVTLTCQGGIYLNGTLTHDGTGAVVMDGQYDMLFGPNGFWRTTNTDADNRASFSASSGNYFIIDQSTYEGNMDIDCSYMDVLRMGDGTHTCYINNNGQASDVVFDHVKFTSCGQIRLYPENFAASILKYLNCDFRDMYAGYAIILGTGGTVAGIDAGGIDFSGCTFAGDETSGSTILFRIGSNTNPVICDDIVDENIAWEIDCLASFDGVAHRKTVGTNQNFQIDNPVGDGKFKNGILEYSVANSHGILCQSDSGVTVEDNYIQDDDTTGAGNAILATEGDGAMIVRRNITRGGNGVVIRQATTSSTVEISRNTFIQIRANCPAGILIEGPGYLGTADIHSNLNLSISPGDEIIFDDLYTSAGGLNLASSIDYNAIYPHTFSERYSVVMDGKSLNDTGLGESDISDSPDLADEDANLEGWDVSLGGSGVVADVFDYFMSRNGFDRDGVAATPSVTYTPAAFRTYIRAKHAPTNSAYDGTGLSGVDIGAVAYEAPATGPTLTSISGDDTAPYGEDAAVVGTNLDTATGFTVDSIDKFSDFDDGDGSTGSWQLPSITDAQQANFPEPLTALTVSITDGVTPDTLPFTFTAPSGKQIVKLAGTMNSTETESLVPHESAFTPAAGDYLITDSNATGGASPAITISNANGTFSFSYSEGTTYTFKYQFWRASNNTLYAAGTATVRDGAIVSQGGTIMASIMQSIMGSSI